MNPFTRAGSYLTGSALLLAMLTGGCASESSDKDRQEPLQNLFFNYQVDGREEEELVTVKLQFQEGGPEADAVHPGEDYTISVDGQPLQADTSRFSGVYFEYQAPLVSFEGLHRIEIKLEGKTLRTDSFNFLPLTFRQTFPDTIGRQGFSLAMAGLESNEELRMVLSDTSLEGDGLNRLFPNQQGLVKVGEEDLRFLAPGTLSVELIREWERPLDKEPGNGGLLRLNYTLRRECFLTD